MFNRNCLQKSKEVCKNRKAGVKRNFIAIKKNTLINIARITKQAKVQTSKEKGKEGPIEVRKIEKVTCQECLLQ